MHRFNALSLVWSVALVFSVGHLHRELSGQIPPSPSPSPQSDRPVSDAQSARAALDRYCVSCHNERTNTAGLALNRADVSQIGADPHLWERVLAKLRTREMPPPTVSSRPAPATYRALVSWLEAQLDREATTKVNPGRVVLHRLNRQEYANAIRDLLAVDVDARSLLPGDDADQHGFENIAGVLSVSPALFERYIAAAKKISRLAVGDLTTPPVFETYQTPKLVEQGDRADEKLPFGSRGGLAFRHWFPVDGEYVIRVTLKRQLYDYIIGVGRQQHIDVRVDHQRVKLFSVGGEAPGTPTPFTFAGNILSDPDWERYMHEADAGLEVRFRAKAGSRVVAVSFVHTPTEPEGILQPEQTGFDRAVNERYDGNAEIDTVAIGGPYNPEGLGDSPSRRRVFSCRPAKPSDEERCAQTILSTLLRRAYRRAASDEDMRAAMAFYRAGHADPDTPNRFDAGIRSALERILAGPDFLFRIERDPAGQPAGTAYRISGVELATRLSFFLWSSIPDDELLDLGLRDKLQDPVVLDRQVRRMLSDGRSGALVENFAAQWLELGKLRGFAADPDLFPEFDEGIKSDLREETARFIGSQLSQDRSVMELLTADYTFLNERLARHYGIPNVYGSRFRRVTMDASRRGGLLGQGSVLALTSYPNRTSPVLRGKWVLDNILGTPPPPAPPDVPGLKETNDDGKPATLRNLMEQHRKNPACAGCHVRMDPLGFALENFDAIGRWRATSDGQPIDAAGALPDGSTFNGLSGLRTLMASHRDDFALTVTRKLLTYSLGREVEYYDLPVVRRIARDAAAADYRWSSIILGIVKSVPFQMRRSES